MNQGTPPPDRQDNKTWFRELLALVKHIFIGVVLFMVLATPAIFLDFLNQGVKLLEVKIAPVTTQTDKIGNNVDNMAGISIQARTVTVSQPVQYALTGFEWLLLIVDVLGVGGYVISSLFKYLRSLKWK
jgi:hypothetical protein